MLFNDPTKVIPIRECMETLGVRRKVILALIRADLLHAVYKNARSWGVIEESWQKYLADGAPRLPHGRLPHCGECKKRRRVNDSVSCSEPDSRKKRASSASADATHVPVTEVSSAQ